MRRVLDREARGERDPALAIAVYLHRLRGAIAAMTAALGGLDVLVFTGGVGERAASLRARAVTGLEFLGVVIDEAANSSAQPDVDISAERATATTLVVRAREDVQIAREVRRLLEPEAPSRSDQR
jgi:acetate kinase